MLNATVHFRNGSSWFTRLNCKHGPDFHIRHHLIVKEVHNLAKTVQLSVQMEAPNLLQDGSQQRPADIAFYDLDPGSTTAADVTFINPLRSDMVEGVSRTPGYALNIREHEKIAKYSAKCQQQHINFLPLVFEPFGGMNKNAILLFRKIASFKSQQTSQQYSKVKNHIFQRISFIIQQQNIRTLFNKISFQNLDEIKIAKGVKGKGHGP